MCPDCTGAPGKALSINSIKEEVNVSEQAEFDSRAIGAAPQQLFVMQ